MTNVKITPMDPVVKAKWIEALRSGKYKQTKEKLKARGGAMCCLGVLCDIYQKENPSKKEAKWVYDAGSITPYTCFDNGADLPSEVAEWAGLSGSDPTTNEKPNNLLAYEKTASFAGLNDTYEYSFKMIADVIERDF